MDKCRSSDQKQFTDVVEIFNAALGTPGHAKCRGDTIRSGV